MSVTLRPASQCEYDAVSLGEVMLRFDPGAGRIRTARSFSVWEGAANTTWHVDCGACLGIAPRLSPR